ncbi:restriction endonuclease [Erwinia billingiae]|uniref:BsuBI/PstI family type II restriction endonuclease n=1 Tax=Erwinia billingiae TaxID=182337 RepID=UPI0019D1A672|nr:BsuBI/PstI family type II restriction endonuclease [Erwinia billingiae]MBN7122409.1 restriction endonuclease [Erwinia billingiae]
MTMPDLPEIADIHTRLKDIFPEGTENRNYVIRELAARTIFVMLYAGAIEGNERWIRPSQVINMSNEQSSKRSSEERLEWLNYTLSKKNTRPIDAWYAENSRESVRDETLRSGLIPCHAVIERKGIPTTSSKPRYCLNASFADLFAPVHFGEDLAVRINNWQETHLNKAALARIRLVNASISNSDDRVTVTFPGGDKRTLAPGPSSIITKEVIEVFASKFLKAPAVLWLSESGNKVVTRDELLASSLGLKIDASKALPDIILVDLGEEKSGSDMLFIFTEVVATDGPVNRERKIALTKIAADAGFSNKNIAFLTAFMDRGSSPFKKAISELAWGSYAWFVSEPENLIDLHDGRAIRLSGGHDDN